MSVALFWAVDFGLMFGASHSGWVALAGIMVIGSRTGKLGPDGKPHAIPPHNMTLGYNSSIGSKLIHQVKRLRAAVSGFHLRHETDPTSA